MRYPAAETAEKHEKILGAASRLFRERGFSGVSVGEIMKATGLTHGPFYNHFASKDALMAGCVVHASEQSLEAMDRACGQSGGIDAYIAGYLSPQHRNTPGEGCLMAALGPEAARTDGVRAAVTRHIEATFNRFVRRVPGRSKREARSESIRSFAAMVGAVVLARAVDDEALSREILKEVRLGLERDASASAARAAAAAAD